MNDEARSEGQPQPSPPPPGQQQPAVPPQAAAPPPPPPPPMPSLPIPAGILARLDFLLQHPEQVLARLREGRDLGLLCTIFLQLALLNSVVYGAVMGSSNLLQGAEMAMEHKLALIGITAVKVPVLFLLTLAIVFPPIYVSNALAGARLSARQMAAVLMGGMAVGSTLLASLATVAFFFSLTSTSYDFIKLLHVAFFAYAGIGGLRFVITALAQLRTRFVRATPLHLQAAWLMLYIFVGTQLAWVLRPFIASPDEPFEVFRDRSGSFYEGVHRSAVLFIRGQSE